MRNFLSVEEQLKRSQKEAEDLGYALDQSSMVMFTDSNGVITAVSDKFCEISKYSRAELLGRDHRLVNSGYHPKEFFTDLWTTISAGRVWRGKIRNRAKDGSFFWMLTTIVPFKAPNGRPFKYIAIRTDITEWTLALEEAERQHAALIYSEKMAALGELAAGIAHELGNPLAAITGRMEFLERQIHAGKGGREETLKTIATVNLLTDRMTSIIRGMSALSRDGTNDPYHTVPVGRMIKDVLSFTSDSFQKHGIIVHFEEVDERIQVSCQETQISQVFVNLVANAKDAILDLEERWIKIEVLEFENEVRVAISDSGKGIPPELREKIMQPFFSTKPIGMGTGLGLSISKSIVEKHGGKLALDQSAPCTRFIVSLPKTQS